MRRQVNEPSSSSRHVPSKIDSSCSTTLQDKRALEHTQILKPIPTIIIMGVLSTLEPRIKQLEEENTKEKDCRDALMSTFRPQSTFLYDRFRVLESGSSDIILWKLTSLRFVFDTAKSSTQLDGAAKDPTPITIALCPLYRTHPHGCNLFVQFYPYGLEYAAGTHASLMFVFFPGDYDDLLE